MGLTGAQIGEFAAILSDRFTSDELAMLLHTKLDIIFGNVARKDLPYELAAAELVAFLDRKEKAIELVRVVRDQLFHVPEVRAICDRLASSGMPVDPPPPSLLERLDALPVMLPRDDLLTVALHRLQQGPLPVLVLQGLTGIGKTLLMARIARTAGPDYQHILALPLDGPAAVEPGYVLEEVNQFLSRLGRGLPAEQLHVDKPERVLAVLGVRLRELGVSVLVLLDAADAAVPSWVAALVRCLAKPPLVRLLATARTRLPGFDEAHMPIPPLRDEEALALVSEYRRMFRLDIDPAAVVSRLPPGIRSHPQALVTLLAQLSDFPLEGLLDWGLPDEVQTPSRLVRQVIAGLEPAVRKALALARLLSGLDFFQAARLLRLTPPAPRDLKVLLDRSLMYRVSAAGYIYVVPAIAGETLAAEDPAAVSAAAEQVAAGWKQALAADADALEVLAPLAVRVAHNLTGAARPDLVHGLAPDALLDRLNLHGFWKEYSLLLRLQIDAAKVVGDRGASVALRLRLLRKQAQTGDPEGAQQTLTEMESLIDLGSLREQAELHGHRALLCGLRRDNDGALKEYLESRRLQIEANNRPGWAAAEAQLGKLHLIRHDVPAARGAFAKAQELIPAEPTSKLWLDAAIGLAICDLSEGMLELAEQALQRALAKCIATGYEAGRAKARLNLAMTVERLGRSAEAVELLKLVVAETQNKDFAVGKSAEMILARLNPVQVVSNARIL